jgi:hypothetical protein
MRLVRYQKRLADGARLDMARPALCALVAILAAACSSGTGSAANKAAPAWSSAKLKVTSTLDGLTALPHRLHWQAFPRPSADITEVDFLIDGKQLWVEHTSPYFYGDDGNYLVTSLLSPGAHTLTVRSVDARGHVATDTVTASVPAAPRPPTALAGTWKGFVKQKSPSSCSPGPCPPAGDWRLVISPIGWQIHDTAGGGGLYDVVYLSPGLAEIRTGMTTGHYNTDGNAWCNESGGDRPDGRAPVRVHWTVHGNLLSFTPVGSQAGSCGFTGFLEFRSGHRAVPWTKAGS